MISVKHSDNSKEWGHALLINSLVDLETPLKIFMTNTHKNIDSLIKFRQGSAKR